MSEAKQVYVVTSGEYSDYGIEVVFLTREEADLYVKNYGGPEDGYYPDLRRVEVFDVGLPLGLVRSEIFFDKSCEFEKEQVGPQAYFYSYQGGDTGVFGDYDEGYHVVHHFRVDDPPEKRIKIASDLLFKAIAENTVKKY